MGMPQTKFTLFSPPSGLRVQANRFIGWCPCLNQSGIRKLTQRREDAKTQRGKPQPKMNWPQKNAKDHKKTI
jgi:hypothetical protein